MVSDVHRTENNDHPLSKINRYTRLSSRVSTADFWRGSSGTTPQRRRDELSERVRSSVSYVGAATSCARSGSTHARCDRNAPTNGRLEDIRRPLIPGRSGHYPTQHLQRSQHGRLIWSETSRASADLPQEHGNSLFRGCVSTSTRPSSHPAGVASILRAGEDFTRWAATKVLRLPTHHRR